MSNPFRKFFEPKLKFVRGTRLVSFLFIACSIIIAAGILFAANMYYNIDTGEVVMEQIQRTTGLLRAVGGVIVAGTSISTLPSGVALEVATTSDVLLSGADQRLRFSGGTQYYVGFRATTTLSTTTVYTWPATDGSSGYVLQTSGNGVLGWTAASAGTITAVGNVTSGAAFTETGDQGTSLWFYDLQGRGQLTIANLTATTTYTLPDLTGVVALQQADTLTPEGVLLADSLGRIVQDTDFTYSTSTDMLQVGGGGIKLLGGGGTYIGLKADATSDNTTYTWPASDGSANYVLTTNSSGGLEWKSVVGAGGVDVTGSPQAGYVTFFYDADTVTGSGNLFWATSTNRLGIGTSTPAYALDVIGTARLSTSLIAPLIEYTGGALTLRTLTSGEIILDSADNIIRLGTGDVILTQGGGPASRPTGEEILREMIPILGFDLPAQCATTCVTSYTQISRVIEDYPFSATTTGTTRVHRFVIRYADTLATTSSSTWRVYNVTDSATTTTFEVPGSSSTSTALDQGNAYVTSNVTIPTDTDDWRLDLKLPSGAARIYQIFLAAYDQVL